MPRGCRERLHRKRCRRGGSSNGLSSRRVCSPWYPVHYFTGGWGTRGGAERGFYCWQFISRESTQCRSPHPIHDSENPGVYWGRDDFTSLDHFRCFSSWSGIYSCRILYPAPGPQRISASRVHDTTQQFTESGLAHSSDLPGSEVSRMASE